MDITSFLLVSLLYFLMLYKWFYSKSSCWKCTIRAVFNIFTELCAHYNNLEHFHHFKFKPIGNHSPFSSSLPTITLQPFVSVDLIILDISCYRNYIICSLLWLTMFKYFIPFKCWIIFHCKDIPFHFSIHQWKDIWVVSIWGLLWMAAVNIREQGFVWTYVFNTFGCIRSSRIAGSYVSSVFNIFEELPECFPKCYTILYSHSSVWVSNFLIYFLAILVKSVFFYSKHLSGSNMFTPSWISYLHFPKDSWCLAYIYIYILALLVACRILVSQPRDWTCAPCAKG